MQKIMKRIAAFMLAAMMVASMSACNRQSEEEPGSSASSGTSSSASSTKSSSKGKDDYKPTVPDVADKMKAIHYTTMSTATDTKRRLSLPLRPIFSAWCVR